MVNGVRGEVEIEISGVKYYLCLTLGALAEIESQLEIKSLSELSTVFSSPSAKHFVVLLSSLCRDTEGKPIDKTVIENLPISELQNVVSKFSEAFNVADMLETSEKK